MKLIPIMSTVVGSTVVVGLNSALQKRFLLATHDQLIPGDVHRAKEIQLGVGGKGQDVAVTLTCLQYKGRLQLVQFVGSGYEGDLVYGMLNELLGNEAVQLTVRTESGMRTCTSIVAADTTTELVEPSGFVSGQEIAELLDRLSLVRADALCFMGSMPPGCPSLLYAQIYERAATPTTICLIDSVSGLEPLLRTIAERKSRWGSSPSSTAAATTVLKVNASELCRLAGVRKATNESGGVRVEEIIQSVLQFLQQFRPYALQALHSIAVTDGSHPAYLAALPVADEDEFRLFQLPIADLRKHINRTSWARGEERADTTSSVLLQTPPSVPHSPTIDEVVLYPIGAGDAVAAGTIAAWKVLHDDHQLHHESGNGSSNVATISSNPTSPSSSSSAGAASFLPPEVHAVLRGNASPSLRAVLTAFAFGLACGSASCLQEQNSALKVGDVLSLYNSEGRPMFLSSHPILLNK